jgi:4-hydroxy-3-polyprenylbenzoate decarboxylase
MDAASMTTTTTSTDPAPHRPRSVFVGVTGASGAPYALRLVQALARVGCELSLSVSDTGIAVLRHELELEGDRGAVTAAFLARAHAEATVHLPGDLEAPMASGSHFPDAAVICPCSMSSVAHIALGTTRTLIHRVGEVALKEGLPLVLVPRETPLSEIHLQRLLEARRAGARIVAPMPAFYARPETVADLVDFVVGKVMSVLGFDQTLFTPWAAERP